MAFFCLDNFYYYSLKNNERTRQTTSYISENELGMDQASKVAEERTKTKKKKNKKQKTERFPFISQHWKRKTKLAILWM